LELVAAIAGDLGVPSDFDIHGWPILSSVCCSSTIAEAGDASSVSGGGPAA
jgi:hypothetical protein